MDFEEFSKPFSGEPNAKACAPHDEPKGTEAENVNVQNSSDPDAAAAMNAAENSRMEDSAAAFAEADFTAPAKDPEKPEETEKPLDSKEAAAVTSETVESMKKTLDDVAYSAKGLGADLSNLAKDVATMKVQISRLAAYDTAVESLKLSLAANQTNEKNLHKEVEEYKKDVYYTNIKPFLLFIISILCDMTKDKKDYSDSMEKRDDEEGKNLLKEICKLLDYYIDGIKNKLSLFGVSIVTFEPDTKYISGKQVIKKSVPTEDAARVECLASVLSDCYMYGEKVLKPADVYVYTRK